MAGIDLWRALCCAAVVTAGCEDSGAGAGSAVDAEPPPPGDSAPVDAGAEPPADAGVVMPMTESVLEYLHSISGVRTIAGQHNREPNTQPALWTDAIYATTGAYPGLWSGDFLFQQENIDARWTMIEEAAAQWKKGAVINLMWHACPPDQGDPCEWMGGVLSELSDDDWTDLVTEGGTLHTAWLARLDDIAFYLQYLEDRGVVVLFRPLHEMNQGVFWWGGRAGPDGTARLYQITRDYLVHTKGLDNLIWVWDVQDLRNDFDQYDFDQYDPGSDYWDVFALDVYNPDRYTTEKYDAMLAIAGDRPIAIGECDRLPTADELLAQPRWLFFMAWAELVYERNTEAEIRALYGAPNVLTLDALPGWAPQRSELPSVTDRGK